jgi:hypothetical protein
VIGLAFGGNFASDVFAATDKSVSGTYYVSPTGSDSNPGTASAPFKTFTKAVSALTAGSILQVAAGTYAESLTIASSGTPDAPITVTGNGAILNVQGAKPNGISISGSYIKVSGFEVIGATDFGILVTGKHVVVENNVVHDNVTRNGVGVCGLSTSWGSALKVKVGGENTIIRNNTVYDNCGEGIAVTRGLTALVENNKVSDNFGVNIYIDNSPFVTVQNNISYCTGTHLRDGNRATGIALGEEVYTGWGAQLHDTLVSGNTITDCRTGIAAYESNVGGTLTNVAILNNIIPSGQKRSISLQTLSNQNVLISNNLIFNSIYVYQSEGVILGLNTLGTAVPSSPTSPPVSPTSTMMIPQATATVTLTSPTMAASATPLPATLTKTPVPTIVSFTATSAPASPTFTSTTVPPSATSVVSTPSFSGTVYDDKDGRFVYSSGWQDVVKRQAYGGSFKLTKQNGSSVTLNFSGQSFSIIYKSGPAFRKMDVYVDNGLVGTINEQTSDSTFQLRWDYPGQLATGNHVLKLVFVTPNTSGKTNGSIDAVIVR